MDSINIGSIYPSQTGFVRGVVKECTSDKIILEGGRAFDFSFPTNGLRQKLEPGTIVAIKATTSESVKEYYVIRLPSIQKTTVENVSLALEPARQ